MTLVPKGRVWNYGIGLTQLWAPSLSYATTLDTPLLFWAENRPATFLPYPVYPQLPPHCGRHPIADFPSHIASSIDTCSTLTLEQQHRDIIAAEGTVPTLQNMVATVNLDCTLDLKIIALHAFTGMFFF
jgi:hypothetical protein